MSRSFRSPLTILAFASGLLLFFLARSPSPSHAVFTDNQSMQLRFEAGRWGECVRSSGYWKNHPDSWPVDEVTLGGVSYSKESAIDILGAPPKGDATYILAQQLIAAKLNVASGADGSAIGETIEMADSWIATNPLGSDPAGEGRDEGIELAELFDAYNAGDGESPACPNESTDDTEDGTPQDEEDDGLETGADLPDGEYPVSESPTIAPDERGDAELTGTPSPAESEDAQAAPES